MTSFNKADLNWDGMYLTYGDTRRFVARFKLRAVDRPGFTKFLIKNFAVEEYFDLIENQKVTPLKALENKGYVSATVKKLLKSSGFPPTREGIDMFFAAKAKKRELMSQ